MSAIKLKTNQLKRSQKVHLTFDGVASCTVAEFFGLGEDDPIPEKGSPEWKQAMDYWRTEGTLEVNLHIEAVTANPAFDPDTIPMFEEHEPDPQIRWVITP